MLYLLNSFSINMIPVGSWAVVVIPIAPEQARKAVSLVKWESAIGHPDVAAIASRMLGTAVPYNRTTVRLTEGDEAVVLQYIGPRLPEGATELPEGARIEMFYVRIVLPEEVAGQSDMIFLLPPHFRV